MERELKYKQAHQWLKTMFPSDMPEMELNDTTIGILWEIMTQNKESNATCTTAVESLNAIRIAYEADAKRLQSILRKASVSTSRKVVLMAEAFSTISVDLNSESFNLSRFADEMCNTLDEKCVIEMKMHKLHSEAEAIEKKVLSCAQLQEKLLNTIKSVEKDMKKQKKQLVSAGTQQDFCECKVQEYERRISKLTEIMSNNGYSTSITNRELVEKSEESQDLTMQITSLKKKLEAFNDLPPDPIVATEMLENSKAELKSLQDKLETIFIQ